MQVHGGQLSLTFLYTIWVDKHAGKNRINLLSAVRKIQLKEGGHVLAKKYIDTLKLNLTCVIDQKTNLGRKPAQICIQILLFNTKR